MNIVRNMEAIVIAAVATTFVTAIATASVRAPRAPTPVAAAPAAAVADDMTTIVVTGKRLTAQQKANFEG